MQNKPKILFRNIDKSPALEENISERVSKLEKRFDHITSCEVSVEETHHHKNQGTLFHVRIRISL